MSEHSPLPWLQEPERPLCIVHDLGDEWLEICRLTKPNDIDREENPGIDEQAIADASFIVRACNSHDQLLSALRWVVETWESDNYIGFSEKCVSAKAAIAAAEGADHA